MRPILVLVLLAACGDDGGSAVPDAGIDAAVDAPVDALPTGCDYVEQHDGTNDTVASGTAEDTHLTFSSKTVICGAFEHTHFDGDITADVDAYHVTVSGDVSVNIYGAGAEAIELVGVDVYGGPAFDQLVGTVTFYGDHGVSAMSLPAGTYELVPFALSSQALTATVPYKLAIIPNLPCFPITTGGIAEANDGAANTGNDMVAFPVGSPTTLTTSPADAPETVPLVVALATRAAVSGTAADVAVADRYEDKDTYALPMGTATNELALTLDWTGAADLDFYLFEENNPDPVYRAIRTTANKEGGTFSVKPGMTYWLLVGAKAGGTGLPATYTATFCGREFRPL